MLVAFIVAILLVRNLPLALRPFFAPRQERNLAAAVVPMVTVVLALVILLVAWKTSRRPFISWPL